MRINPFVRSLVAFDGNTIDHSYSPSHITSWRNVSRDTPDPVLKLRTTLRKRPFIGGEGLHGRPLKHYGDELSTTETVSEHTSSSGMTVRGHKEAALSSSNIIGSNTRASRQIMDKTKIDSPTSVPLPGIDDSMDKRKENGWLEEGKDTSDGDCDGGIHRQTEHSEPLNQDAVTGLYATNLPKANFSASINRRSSFDFAFISPKKGPSSLSSAKSFQTAQSSLASYTSARSGSLSLWQRDAVHTEKQSVRPKKEHFFSRSTLATIVSPQAAYENLLQALIAHALSRGASTIFSSISQQETTKLKDLISAELSPLRFIISESSNIFQRNLRIHALVEVLVNILTAYKVSGENLFNLGNELNLSTLQNDIYVTISRFAETSRHSRNAHMTSEIFSSEWLMYLRYKGILGDPREELDWSGKGQHVQYDPEDESEIPLEYEKTLGHSQTAIIDSVKCRRIRLARKKITCNRRLKKEDAIVEVEHLVRLRHSHIVRVVGTYTTKTSLAILLYPAAEWDLDAYMDELLDEMDADTMRQSSPRTSAQALRIFLGCLSHAIHFIHDQNVKHMDIKPKNILVRLRGAGSYKVYVADFGIARAYKSAAESETDSPIPYTRTYAAPEVVLQDKRGFSADIFSLGCVFMEMMATVISSATGTCDERQRLLALRKESSGNAAFYANIDMITRWYEETVRVRLCDWNYGVPGVQTSIVDLCPRMVMEAPDSRPSASELKETTTGLCCSECNTGPEPFEAAN